MHSRRATFKLLNHYEASGKGPFNEEMEEEDTLTETFHKWVIETLPARLN